MRSNSETAPMPSVVKTVIETGAAKTSGVSIDTTLNITGTGGFTIGDFNSPDDKTIEDVPAGTYEVVMTDNDSGTVCKFTAKYEENGKGAAKIIKVVAN